MINKTFVEDLKVVEALTPATDAAGRTGDYINCKTLHKVVMKFHVKQGDANTILITPKQADTAAGGNVKALAVNVPIWTNLDCANTDAFTRQTDAVNYTTDAGVTNKLVIFEIDPAGLDTVNGFKFLTIVTGASNVGNLTEATFIGVPRYGGKDSPTILA